jgi:molybdate transport system substrate-binding protein
MVLRRLVVGLIAFGLVQSVHAEDITVSAAISLKESLEAIGPQYESSSGDHIKLTLGASGQLSTQIANGAPVDLFISAAKQQVDDLKKVGKTVNSSACVVVSNEMVLIVPAGAKSAPASFEELADAKVSRIAVGEPKTVPAGQYAKETLEHLKLTQKLTGKLIYGMNVRQVLQYVESGEVDAGIVYLSDAQQAGQKVTIVATAKPEWHEPIEYWGVAISGAAHASAAERFLAYLKEQQAQQVFQAHGFTAPTSQPATQPAK